MKKKYIWKFLGVAILSILFTIALFIAESRKVSPDISGMFQNIILSIFCSIVASVIFGMMQIADGKDGEKEEKEFREAVNQKLKEINTKLTIQENLYDSGILSIRKKSYYDREGKFWKDIIESSADKLDLIGHSIHNWFEDEYKKIFVEKIRSMLKAGKEVRIILSGDKPDMKKIREVENTGEGRHLLSDLENTCFELRKIASGLPKPKYKKRLKVFVTDLSQVTYMYIRTDTRCFISPYIHSTTNSSNTFLLELDTKVEYSKCFERDFEDMLRRAEGTYLNLEE